MSSINSVNTVRNLSASTATAGSSASLGMFNRQATTALSNVTAGVGIGVAPKFAPTLNEDEAVDQARLLKALADPTRLRILSLLSRHEGEVCVFEIVESFTLEQPTISHHLRILLNAGLVDYRKRGLYSFYYVDKNKLKAVSTIINGLANNLIAAF